MPNPLLTLMYLATAGQRVRRRRDDRGASATEYGLLAVAIAAVIALVVFAFGDVTNEMFADTCESVKSAAGTSQNCS